MYDAIIFDKDGVLLDSMANNFRWADKIRVRIYREKGTKVSREEASSVVRAKKPADIEFLIQEKGLTEDEIVEVERRVREEKIQKIKRNEIELFSTVPSTLETLDVPKAVVSNAPLKVTKYTMEHFGLNSHFETVRSPRLEKLEDYIRMKKPNPEMVEQVIEHMDVENPLMVGDTSDDVKVAENAGIDSVLVNGFKDYSHLNPDYRLDSLEDLPSIIR